MKHLSIIALAFLWIGSAHAQSGVAVETPMAFTDNSANEDGFVVERSADPAAEVWETAMELPASEGLGDVRFVLTLPAGELWSVRAVAFNQYGRSDPTNALELDFRPPGSPGGMRTEGDSEVVVHGNLRVMGNLAVAGAITQGEQ